MTSGYYVNGVTCGPLQLKCNNCIVNNSHKKNKKINLF